MVYIGFYKTNNFENQTMKKIIIKLLIFASILFSTNGCIQPVMSCAGIKTYPRCAKFCTHDAVATCEASVNASIDSLLENHQRNMRNIYKPNYDD